MKNYNIRQGLRNIKEKGLASALKEDWLVTKERFLDFAKYSFRGIVLFAQPVTLYRMYKRNRLWNEVGKNYSGRLQLLK